MVINTGHTITRSVQDLDLDYNDWYADAGNVHYGPRLGGTSYGNRTKNKSFVMQEDGFDNPRMRAQGLIHLLLLSTEGGAAQDDGLE